MQATITLVGPAGSDELEALLGELLERQAVACRFVRSERFDPDELFAEDGAASGVRVFVVLRGPASARLYLRGPGGERFLLRALTLPHGLDELGRELVGQVVESSVLALFRSSEGLSRAQASAELERESSEPKPAAPPAEPEAPAARESQPNDATTLVLLAGARFRASYTGPDLGAALAPGLELGAGLRTAVVFRARVAGELGLAQSLATSELDASVSVHSLRAGVDAGLPFGSSQALLLGLSGGVDVWNVDEEAHADDVSPVPAFSHTTGAIRTEFRYEKSFGSLVFAATGLCDFSLLDVHYDLLEDEGKSQLAAPWAVRPGAALGVGGQF